MKHLFLLLGLGSASLSFAQTSDKVDVPDSTGLPGDYFSLEGALDLFKQSTSPEEFEKKLNVESSNVNNLDLNDDGKADYIRVISKGEGTSHVLILQVPVKEKESQDVAVIEIEKNGENSAICQIIGDEELYGDSVFVEPVDETNNSEDVKTGKGPNGFGYSPSHVVVNVWFWPCIRYMYGPHYVFWVSPWYWGYYPGWYHPWHRHYWHHHYHHSHHWHHHYYHVGYHRVMNAHKVYGPHRVGSPYVKQKYVAHHAKHKAYKKTHPVKYNNPPVKKNNPAPHVKQPVQKKPVQKQPVQKAPKVKKGPPQKSGGQKGSKPGGGGAPKSKGGRK